MNLYIISNVATSHDNWDVTTTFASIAGATLVATDGTVGLYTVSANKLTISNAGTKIWNGTVWGV